MKPIRVIQFMLLFLSLLKAFSLFAGVYAKSPETMLNLALPASRESGHAVPPAPPRDHEPLPAELVATWYTGALPLTDVYDSVTGEWRDQNGLGESYTFAANGEYIYAAFLRLQNGQCLTEASAYRTGKAHASAGKLTLIPNVAKTRTVIRCGSNSDTTTDGPFETTALEYGVTEEANGLVQLNLTDQGHHTAFYRQGMVESLVGTWQRGGLSSVGFYDPAMQSFTPQDKAGGWYRFNADGTYSFGEFGYGTDNKGCALTAWLYQEGTLEIAGGRLTTKPITGALRVDNACNPGAPEVTSYVESERSYTWLYRDRISELKLVIIPLDFFQEFVYTPE